MMNNIAIVFTVIFSFLLPVGAVIWWRRKTKAPMWGFITGAICFILFAKLLEQGLHALCLIVASPISRTLNSSPVLFTIYAVLTAGIFEETGRLFGFKVMLKDNKEKSSAVAYGIGHGGIEVILVLGMVYVVLLLAKIGVPMKDSVTTAAVIRMADTLQLSTICLAVFERIPAMIIHIALSMIVYVAARQKGRFMLYPLAIILHSLVDVPAALFQFGLPIPLASVECAAAVFAVVYIYLGKRILNSMTVSEDSDTIDSDESDNI